MEYGAETTLYLAASLLGAALLAGTRLSVVRDSRRASNALHAAAAVLGLLAFYDFGVLRHQHDTGFVHRWEQFHYHLGAKYFPELGYDGLYAASLAAQEQSRPGSPLGAQVRDLRTNEVVPTAALLPEVREVVARFRPERWRSFVADHTYFVRSTSPGFMERIRLDHGYNPTPAWTFVARLLFAWMPAGEATSALLGGVDVVLIALIFAAIHRTYGFRTTCWSAALFGLCFGWRYNYVGALMRLDWLAAVVGGICLLERRRPALAGGLFGYAAVVRIFPALFLAGPAVVALRAFVEGERPRWPFRLAAGFGGVVAAGLVAGCFAGRGVHAWPEFAGDIWLHFRTHPFTRVGLDVLTRTDPIALVRNLASPHPIPEQVLIAEPSTIQSLARVGLQLGLLALFGAAAWGASLGRAAVMSVAVVFALAPLGAYYWVMVIVMPLAGGRREVLLALILFAAALYAHLLWVPAQVAAPVCYFAISWAMALLLPLWLLPAARAGVAAWRSSPP